jgi:DNA-binding MarR family transcriptional regulator
MANLPQQITELDRTVHEPARLAILTVLSACEEADFVFLQCATGLTNGNLSAHLSKLEDAGLIEITKRFLDKKPQTLVSLTAIGRSQITLHWYRLEELRNTAVQSKPRKKAQLKRLALKTAER